MSENISI